MNIKEAISELDKQVANPSAGLPDDVFCYISRTTPLVNVDLLIQDEQKRTLLSWRDDLYYGKGWHVPGGIVRFKETMEERVNEVARIEIGAVVGFDPSPIAVTQFMHPERKERGHFISFLYRCFLSSAFVPENKGLSHKDAGFLLWHSSCPDNLLECQKMYRKFISA
jgi:colanic acid biosynthesis protein WcaH